MTDQGKRTSSLPIKEIANTVSDRVVFVFNASNTTTAQTATIAINDLLSSANLSIVCKSLVLDDSRSDPTGSNALTIPEGTLFFSSEYGYLAIADNVLKRWPLVSF